MAERVRVRDRQRRAEGVFRLARRIVWQAYYNFDKDNGWMMAGHIAYMGLFALFPFLIFLVALAGFLGQGEAADNSVELGLELLPEDVASALKPAIDEVRRAPHAGLMTFGILATLWASSSGLEALRHALNLAYAVADQPAFWRTRIESLLLTILAAVVVIVVMVLLVVVPLVVDTIQIVFHQQAGTAPEPGFLAGPRDALGFLLLLGLLMLLYRVLPSVRLRATEIVPGAVLAWVLWSPRSGATRSTCAACPASASPTAAWAASSSHCSSSTFPPSCLFSAPSSTACSADAISIATGAGVVRPYRGPRRRD